MSPVKPFLKLEDIKKGKTTPPYRELVRYLNYVAMMSRLDLCYVINYRSRFQENPVNAHWIHLKRVLKYIKSTNNLIIVLIP